MEKTMRINFLIKFFVIASSIILVTACSTFKHNKTSAAATNNTEQVAVKTEGLGNEQTGFSEQSGDNKLKAPSDQVYYFDFDKFDIHQDDVASINAQATYLTSHPEAKVRIEGHADERGSREYNVALGWRRAKSLAGILKQQGVTAKQIVMVSFGKEKPVAFGHDEASYGLNRRVNLIYEAK
jgi:peptidoglycan-associated lipoprotein